MLLRTLPLLRDFEHTIITLKEPGVLAPQLVAAGITVHTISSRGLFDIAGLLRLQTFIRKAHPHLIITYLLHADLIGRLFLYQKNTPIIPFLRTTYNHPTYFPIRVFERLSAPFVKEYLANSEAVKDFYTTTYKVTPGKITVIANGIDIESIRPQSPSPALRDSLGIAPTDMVIICVANLHTSKGHSYLLEAFEHFFRTHPNTTLLLVGDGIEKENLQIQIRSYTSKDKIRFLGIRTDVPFLLRLSHIFVLPTLFEGMSNALMEAMACGLPVITTTIPENAVLIQDNATGILVPPKNSTVLCEAILRLSDHPALRTQISKNARQYIEEHFSLQKTIQAWTHFCHTHTRPL